MLLGTLSRGRCIEQPELKSSFPTAHIHTSKKKGGGQDKGGRLEAAWELGEDWHHFRHDPRYTHTHSHTCAHRCHMSLRCILF